MKKKNIITKCKYAVDIPNADSENWICVDYFFTKKEAIKFAQKMFGADSKGNVNLISNL